MKRIDPFWSTIIIDIVVNRLQGTLTFVPMYLCENHTRQQVLVVTPRTHQLIHSTFLSLCSADGNTQSHRWNKLRLTINSTTAKPAYSMDKKYDHDIDWFYSNLRYRERISLSDELLLISFDGLPSDYHRFWREPESAC